MTHETCTDMGREEYEIGVSILDHDELIDWIDNKMNGNILQQVNYATELAIIKLQEKLRNQRNSP